MRVTICLKAFVLPLSTDITIVSNDTSAHISITLAVALGAFDMTWNILFKHNFKVNHLLV